MGIYAIGILASLPLTFVPFHLLFERVAPGAAIVASWRGFIGNTAPLLVYAAASLLPAFPVERVEANRVVLPAIAP